MTLTQDKIGASWALIWNMVFHHIGCCCLHFLDNLQTNIFGDAAMLKAQNPAYLLHLKRLHRICLADMNGA